MATATYPPVQYKSLVNSDNSFMRPRQKTWGVFIISGIQPKSAINRTPVNYGPDIPFATYNTSTFVGVKDSGGSTYNAGYIYDNVVMDTADLTMKIPATGPMGETITPFGAVSYYFKTSKTPPSSGKVSVSTATGTYQADGYNAVDLVPANKVFYYNANADIISWDLILITRNLQEAKNLVNNWLRQPDTTKPLAGLDSVIICEIVPSDSIVEL